MVFSESLLNLHDDKHQKLTLDIQKTLERFWNPNNVGNLSRSINITNSRSINITIMRKKKSKMIHTRFVDF